ncbi:hypothetical protein C0992_004501 [Termitomyces sp. T32_za158]|nr:hypothetical protein C0992_004501 [Termitomyces sp. T32_za158]
MDLAVVLAEHMAEVQAARFLALAMVGMETSGKVVGTEAAAVGEVIATKPEAASKPLVPVVETVATEESVDESEAQDGKDEADNEDEMPVTSK